jgi:hypothetical protein
MKKIVASFLVLIASLSYAANGFELKFTENNGTVTILHDPKDWVEVYDSSGMSLSVNNGGFLEVKDFRILHSKITYKEAKQFLNGEKIHHIFSYGLVDCKAGVLYLIGDLYTNEKFEMLYKKDYEVGDFIAKITEPNTAANEVYGVMCRDYLT